MLLDIPTDPFLRFIIQARNKKSDHEAAQLNDRT